MPETSRMSPPTAWDLRKRRISRPLNIFLLLKQQHRCTAAQQHARAELGHVGVGVGLGYIGVGVELGFANIHQREVLARATVYFSQPHSSGFFAVTILCLLHPV